MSEHIRFVKGDVEAYADHPRDVAMLRARGFAEAGRPAKKQAAAAKPARVTKTETKTETAKPAAPETTPTAGE